MHRSTTCGSRLRRTDGSTVAHAPEHNLRKSVTTNGRLNGSACTGAQLAEVGYDERNGSTVTHTPEHILCDISHSNAEETSKASGATQLWLAYPYRARKLGVANRNLSGESSPDTIALAMRKKRNGSGRYQQIGQIHRKCRRVEINDLIQVSAEHKIHVCDCVC